MRTRGLRDIHRRPWIGGLGPDVQKERSVRFQNALYRSNPLRRPFEIMLARQRVVVAAVANAKIVRRRGDHRRDRHGGNPSEDVETVSEIKPKRAGTGFGDGVGSWKLAWYPRVRHRAFSVARPMWFSARGCADFEQL